MLRRFDPFHEFFRFPVGTSATATDMTRTDDELIVDIDLPGADPESIEITVENRTLSITAERNERREGGTALRRERPRGTYRRELYLGTELDTEAIQADYREGVLSLHIGWSESVKPRKVLVGTGRGALEEAS